MKPLNNINDICLNVPSLIEASAGTGKTYTLAELFIRALRELEDATVESILVVTFTNAAAAELRGRLHARLLQEREKARKQSGENFEKWNTALLTFDKAGITTIHGFCERMLAEFAFEGSLPFNAELADRSDEVVRELSLDYWRKRFYSGEIDSAVIRQCGMFDPGEISALTQFSIAKPLARVEPEKAEIATGCIEAVESLRRMFPAELSALGIRPSAKKQIADFESLRALFDDPAWNQIPAELKISRVIESSRALAASTNKGLADIAEVLRVINDGYTPLNIRLMVEARNELATSDAEGLTKVGREVRRQGVRTFDDVLNDLRLMLERNPQAVEAMRRKFKLAMIDEFQDTDPVQWQIFHSVFMEGPEPHRIIVVGDPKQAIYSFRGGDIDTYCAVRDEITRIGGSVWTLTTNYRSEPSAVDAVNRVFLSKDDTKPTATFEKREGGTGIRYGTIEAKTSNAETTSISLLQRADSAPLADPSIGDSPGIVLKKFGKGADRNIAEDIVAEIRTLLNASEWKIFDYGQKVSSNSVASEAQKKTWIRNEGRPVRPGDICILSNKNDTARFYHDKLCLNAIPCTIRSEISVFAEEEAQWIRSLMMVAISSARKGFGNLLATPLFGVAPDVIVRYVEGRIDGLDDYAGIIRAERGKLSAHGIQSFFASVADKCQIKTRLLAGPLGERHWTNLSQIIEILGSIAKTNHLTPEALQDWLDEAIRRSSEKMPEYEFRLDSDAEAVTSMTIHKSKGLEFPIVFIPEFDTGIYQKHSIETFHRSGKTIISCMPDSDATESTKAENLEEAVRKLYVGLTRAVHRTTLYIGDQDYASGKDATSVMGHLQVHSQVFQIPEENLKHGTVIVLRGEDTRAVSGYPQTSPILVDAPKKLEQPPSVVPVAKPWSITSFSGIKASTEREDGESFSWEAAPGADEPKPAFAPDEEDVASARVVSRYTLRGGPVFGNALHSVFETCPFDADEKTISGQVAKSLTAWHLNDLAADTSACTEIAGMIYDTLQAELISAGGVPFKLGDVPPEKRLSELEFHFPLPDHKTLSDFLNVIRGWGGIYEMALRDVVGTEKMIRGMLKGFIDLLFEQNGKYYIVDWKTNILDGRPESFAIDAANPLGSRIAMEIAHSQYALQWAIYTLAMHRHLRNTVPGYDYATHFGGVRYLFVRGVSPAHPGAGVWVQTPPPAAAIELLDQFLED